MQEADKKLLKKFFNNTFSLTEYNRIKELLHLPEAQQVLEDLTWEEWLSEENDTDISDDDEQRVKQALMERVSLAPLKNPVLFSRYVRVAAAFIGALLLALGTFYLPDRAVQDLGNVDLHSSEADIAPGGNKAILTLSNGQTVTLDDFTGTEITEADGVRIRKTSNGEIVYDTHLHNGMKNSYNHIVTPKGGQYRVILPDGSKAWLNAGSSLRYPVLFNDRERFVEMTGEVYFEVKSLLKKDGHGRVPFIVRTSKQEIQVLGTEFNVNAYDDEPAVKTSLVEGSVRLLSFSNGQSVLLKPGEQAILNDKFKVIAVDLQQELAWKNGDFIFKGDDLATILRCISRWYDLDVECEERLGKVQFTGIISRSTPLADLLKMIESTKEVKITIKGRRLIVSE